MKISVVVPIYNVEVYLERCLDSIVNQTLKELEIILVDDGSNDGSNRIARTYAGKDSRVILLVNEKNIGQGLSRQKGLAYARGEYVTFVDSDDFIGPEMYEDLYRKAKEREYDVVGSDFTYVSPDGKRIVNAIDRERIDKLDYTYILDRLFSSEQNHFIPNSLCDKIYKLDFIRKNKIEILSERMLFLEDLVFNVHFFSCRPTVAWLPQSYYNYMLRKGSTMYSYRRQFVDRYKMMNQELSSILRQHGIEEDKYRHELDQNLFRYTFVFLTNCFHNPDYKSRLPEFYRIIKDPYLKKNLKKISSKEVFHSNDSWIKKWIKYMVVLFMRYI